MSEEKSNEQFFEAWLDHESDAEFGAPIVRDQTDHGARDTVDANLRYWSAEEFSSIYVRFRPHLERHAQRYLSNRMQAEEVVQDAFLYLMTSLPELDSELGVLKFLKWKVRLLALDSIRKASNRYETHVDEYQEFASEDLDLSADLERAEDNAVIRLALARLNPRQREAIIASVYEEKTAEEVAEQLGLNQNATRQLLHRAKSSFRKALIGEADARGKSVAEILTIASRKIARDAKENAIRTSVLIVALAAGVGIIPQLSGPQNVPVADSPQSTETFELEGDFQDSQVPFETPELPDTEQPAAIESPNPSDSSSEPEETIQEDTRVEVTLAEPAVQETQGVVSNGESVRVILSTNVQSAGIYADSKAVMFADIFEGVSIEVFGGTGVSAFLDFDPELQTVKQVLFQMRIDGEPYLAVANELATEKVKNPIGSSIAIIAKDFYLVDASQQVFSESIFSDSSAAVTLELDEAGRPTEASLRFGRD